MGDSVFKAPNQGEDKSFGYWIALHGQGSHPERGTTVYAWRNANAWARSVRRGATTPRVADKLVATIRSAQVRAYGDRAYC